MENLEGMEPSKTKADWFEALPQDYRKQARTYLSVLLSVDFEDIFWRILVRESCFLAISRNSFVTKILEDQNRCRFYLHFPRSAGQVSVRTIFNAMFKTKEEKGSNEAKQTRISAISKSEWKSLLPFRTHSQEEVNLNDRLQASITVLEEKLKKKSAKKGNKKEDEEELFEEENKDEDGKSPLSRKVKVQKISEVSQLKFLERGEADSTKNAEQGKREGEGIKQSKDVNSKKKGDELKEGGNLGDDAEFGSSWDLNESDSNGSELKRDPQFEVDFLEFESREVCRKKINKTENLEKRLTELSKGLADLKTNMRSREFISEIASSVMTKLPLLPSISISDMEIAEGVRVGFGGNYQDIREEGGADADVEREISQKAKIAKLDQELLRILKLFANKSEEASQIQGHRDQLVLENEKILEKIAKRDGQIHELEGTCAQLKLRVNELENQKLGESALIVERQDQLKEATAIKEKLVGRLEKATVIVGELNKQVEELSQTQSGMEEEIKILTEAKDKLEKTINDMSKAKAGIEKELKQATAMNDESEKTLKEASEARIALEKELRVITAAMDHLERDLAETKSSFEAKLKEEADTKRKVEEELKKKVIEVSKEKTGMEGKLEEMTKFKALFESKFNESVKVNNVVQAKLEEADLKYTTAIKKLEEANRSKADFEEKLKEADNEVSELRKRMIQLAKNEEASHKKMKEQREKLLTGDTKISELENKLGRLEKENKLMKAVLTADIENGRLVALKVMSREKRVTQTSKLPNRRAHSDASRKNLSSKQNGSKESKQTELNSKESSESRSLISFLPQALDTIEKDKEIEPCPYDLMEVENGGQETLKDSRIDENTTALKHLDVSCLDDFSSALSADAIDEYLDLVKKEKNVIILRSWIARKAQEFFYSQKTDVEGQLISEGLSPDFLKNIYSFKYIVFPLKQKYSEIWKALVVTNPGILYTTEEQKESDGASTVRGKRQKAVQGFGFCYLDSTVINTSQLDIQTCSAIDYLLKNLSKQKTQYENNSIPVKYLSLPAFSSSVHSGLFAAHNIELFSLNPGYFMGVNHNNIDNLYNPDELEIKKRNHMKNVFILARKYLVPEIK